MSWDNQRRSKAERLQAAAALCCGKTVATGDIVKLMEAVIRPGDKVVLEGDNQKQAAFLAASLAEVNPKVIHDLTMIIPSISRSEHLDYFEKGIASTVDFAFAGTQAQRLSEMLAEGKVKIGNFNTYLEIYARLSSPMCAWWPPIRPTGRATCLPGTAPRRPPRWWRLPPARAVSSLRR